MSDAFANLVPDTRSFLSELALHNTRDWFQDNKDWYDHELKRPAELLLEHMVPVLHKMTDKQVTTKLFRPHRDVRFSKDKTPYHQHLHMAWTTHSPGRQSIGWFFGISPEYISIGAGMMAFEKDSMIHWRNTIDGPNGVDVVDTLIDLKAQGFRVDEPELKRVPAPYSKDHPRHILLRRKSLTVWRDFDEMPDPVETLRSTFKTLMPIAKLLRQIS